MNRDIWVAIKITALIVLVIMVIPLVLVIENRIPGGGNWVVLILQAIAIVSAVTAGWFLKRRLHRRMERGLGRKVSDAELTSLTTWMRIPNAARKAAGDADDYNFDGGEDDRGPAIQQLGLNQPSRSKRKAPRLDK
jgi:hypothetical protein